MSNLAERLQIAIKQAGSNPSKVAKAIKVSEQAPQKWKKGQISVDTLTNVIKEIGVDANWLLLGDTINTVNNTNNGGMFVAGDNHGTQIQNNHSHNTTTHTTNHYTQDDEWLIITSGDMLPVFAVGDKVRIDTSQAPQAGSYVLVSYDGGQILRKYRPKFDDDGKEYIQLIASNDDFPIIDSRHKVFEVLGVAVEFKRRLI